MDDNPLGVDLGTKYIGLAIADDIGIARPIAAIKVDGNEFDKIIDAVEDNLITKLVVGMPRNMQGEKTKESQRVEQVVEQLQSRLKQDVVLQDESVTSVQSKSLMGEEGYTKEQVDSLSAALILQDYLNDLNSGNII